MHVELPTGHPPCLTNLKPDVDTIFGNISRRYSVRPMLIRTDEYSAITAKPFQKWCLIILPSDGEIGLMRSLLLFAIRRMVLRLTFLTFMPRWTFPKLKG